MHVIHLPKPSLPSWQWRISGSINVWIRILRSRGRLLPFVSWNSLPTPSLRHCVLVPRRLIGCLVLPQRHEGTQRGE